jgi:serine protease SohB
MLACTSSPGCLYAAPFAVLGSIGVVGQSLNIHKTLEGWGIQPLVFRGGKNKAPVGWIGEVTQEGIDKVQSMIDDTHRAFKRHVADCRPMVAQQIENIATGDIWLGYDALEKGLIDRIITSDEYIGERIANGARVLKLVQLVRSKNPFSRPTTSTVASLSNTGQGTDTGSLASLLPFLADFRLLLKRVTDALDGFTGDRFPALVASRVTGVTDMAHPTSHK